MNLEKRTLSKSNPAVYQLKFGLDVNPLAFLLVIHHKEMTALARNLTLCCF
jgi:hypothetical protein